MVKLKMMSKWQSGCQKGVLLGAIGMVLCSWTAAAGQKIVFSEPTLPIGADAPTDPRKDVIKSREPSLFGTPGAGISAPSSPAPTPSQRSPKSQPREDTLFPDSTKEPDFLSLESKKDSSLSSLKNTKESSLARAWASSTTKDPWNDDSSSKDRNSSDPANGRKQNDRSNSRNSSESHLDRNGRNTELEKSYASASKYGGSGLSQLMDRLGDYRGDRDDQALQMETALMFKNMRNSTSPIGDQDVNHSVHDSMWNQFSKPYGNAYSQQSDSFLSSSKKDRQPTFGTGSSFSSLYSPQPTVANAANASLQSLGGDRSTAAPPKPQQPTMLPMPKRPGQPF